MTQNLLLSFITDCDFCPFIGTKQLLKVISDARYIFYEEGDEAMIYTVYCYQKCLDEFCLVFYGLLFHKRLHHTRCLEESGSIMYSSIAETISDDLLA